MVISQGRFVCRWLSGDLGGSLVDQYSSPESLKPRAARPLSLTVISNERWRPTVGGPPRCLQRPPAAYCVPHIALDVRELVSLVCVGVYVRD